MRFSGNRLTAPHRDGLGNERVAFANARGGVCVLGAEDKARKVVGILEERLDKVEALPKRRPVPPGAVVCTRQPRSHPPVADQRLSLAPDGRIRYELKAAWRDGTTAVLLDPMDFMARRVALVPRPRVNLARYHGLFAPSHAWRGQITPARRGKGGRPRP